MLMNKYISLVISLGFFICSCTSESTTKEPDNNVVRDADGKIVSGEMKKYYPNGKLESVFNLANYKLHGPAKKYYEDGSLRSELLYAEGKLAGIQKRYYESGALYKEEPFVKGERHGLVKKYRESGDLMTEAMYRNGQPGTVLKEYLTDGSLKTRYPKIVVKEINKVSSNGEYIVRVSMSDQSTNVKYYIGELDEGIYFTNDLKQQSTGQEGIMELKAYLKPGEILDQEINIVARMPTRLNNTFITSHRVKLKVRR